MRDIPKLMIQQLESFISDSKIIDKYYKMGHKITWNLDDSTLIVKYKRKKFVISIVKKDKQYYWHLEPYKKSYFETEVDFEHCKLNYVLFAISESRKKGKM